MLILVPDRAQTSPRDAIEALRRASAPNNETLAELDLIGDTRMDNSPYPNSSPAVWAPFVLIGAD